jgi:hypothetical protein
VTSVALASRRFRQLCCAPELLRNIRVDALDAKALPTARALLPWLMQHGAHVQRLQLRLTGFAESDRSELASLISSCVTACGTAGQLQELELSSETPLAPLAWLPAMRSLQWLDVGSYACELKLTADASGLTALQHMRLHGQRVIFAAPARLPLALTSLQLCGDGSPEMPQQVGTWADV